MIIQLWSETCGKEQVIPGTDHDNLPFVFVFAVAHLGLGLVQDVDDPSAQLGVEVDVVDVGGGLLGLHDPLQFFSTGVASLSYELHRSAKMD